MLHNLPLKIFKVTKRLLETLSVLGNYDGTNKNARQERNLLLHRKMFLQLLNPLCCLQLSKCSSSTLEAEFCEGEMSSALYVLIISTGAGD